MNGFQGAALGLGKSGNNVTGSPISVQSLNNSPVRAKFVTSIQGRKRLKVEGSPESAENWDGDESRIGVKRACNECRQQKLRCDVVQKPFQMCSRCQRCSLECRIDSTFKRVGKRKKNAEMERELLELRNQLASQQSSPGAQHIGQPFSVTQSPRSPPILQMQQSSVDHFMGSQEAVAGLMELRSGGEGGLFIRSPNGLGRPSRTLEGVVVTAEQVQQLFNYYFTLYHPFLPILEPDWTPDYYYEKWPLLFWTIIAVGGRHYAPIPGLAVSLSAPVSKLLWATLADVPQSYHIIKGLCVLCSWPSPTSSTSTDTTYMISGVTMQIALQIGLHRPTHAQDFSRFRVELREEELKDRVRTWAACNMVAQRVSTGYGQPPTTIYDWTLSFDSKQEESFKLPKETEIRLRIEMFSNEVTRALYSNSEDPVGLADPKQKPALTALLAKRYRELKGSFPLNISSINALYLKASNLHQHLSVFFDAPESKTYCEDLLALYTATQEYVEGCFTLETAVGSVIRYATNYILQMLVAAGFTLFKLLNSFFAKFIDLENGKRLFSKTITTIREISVVSNDLPSRLAEVLAQMWRDGGAGSRVSSPVNGGLDNSLQLKTKARMSMSLIYDSLWRWREEFLEKGRGNLDAAVKNPTNPDSAADSTASSVIEQTLGLPISTHGRSITPSQDDFGETTYEVFDPLNWMLDGLMEFPYSFSAQNVDATMASTL